MKGDLPVENNRLFYVNVLAEGAKEGEQVLDHIKVDLAARAWKRGNTVVHYKLYGTETLEMKDGTKKEMLFGDVGVAKIYLPLEMAALDPKQRPSDLFKYWVSGVIEDFDIKDTGNRVLVMNRAKALKILKERNALKLRERKLYAVIQRELIGAYLVNAGGYTALLPKAYYDWDRDKKAKIGEEFPVMVLPSREGAPMIVSRRDAITNPYAMLNLNKNAEVGGVLTRMNRNGTFLVEITKGVTVSVDPINMRRIPELGDFVTIRIIGNNHSGPYGVFEYATDAI